MHWWKQDQQITTSSKFNIISLSNASSPYHPKKTCPIHHAVLIPKRNDTTGEYEPGLIRCPLCGSTYSDGPVNKDTY